MLIYVGGSDLQQLESSIYHTNKKSGRLCESMLAHFDLVFRSVHNLSTPNNPSDRLACHHFIIQRVVF